MGKRAGNRREAQLIFLGVEGPQSQALKEGLIVIMKSSFSSSLPFAFFVFPSLLLILLLITSLFQSSLYILTFIFVFHSSSLFFIQSFLFPFLELLSSLFLLKAGHPSFYYLVSLLQGPDTHDVSTM